MPIDKQNNITDLDIEAIIDSAELDELRKKYADVDSDATIDEETASAASKDEAVQTKRKGFLKREKSQANDNSPPKNSVSAPSFNSQDTDSAAPFPVKSSVSADVDSVTVNTDSETAAPALSQGDVLISDDSLEKLMSSFRVVYEESINKLDSFPPAAPAFSVDEIISEQPALELPEQTPEPEETQKNADKNEAVNDFLSTLRVIYEAPDDDVPADEPKIEKSTGQPAPELPEPPPELSIASLFKKEEPTAAGLAELLMNADNNKPRDGSFKRFLKNVFPCKGDGIGEIIRKTILLIAVLTMLVCGVILLNIYIISPYLISRESQKAVDLKTNSNIAATWANAQDKFPGIDFPTGMQLKYAEFYAVNNDFAAWLEIPGAGIDMPIVKGDNNSEYLKKTFYGEKSKYGCCFLDSSNNLLQLDRNTVIYGHNMSYDDLMFGPLEVYKKLDGFKASPVIHFGTLYKDTKWKIYAVFITNGASSGDNGYLFNYIFRNLSSDDVFRSYIAQVDQRKLYTTGVDILPSDKILTLSTCIYDFKNARLAVVARQVRDGEDETVDISKAAEKKNPRYPQAWYSANGLNNPYKDAEKWMPN